MAGLTSNFTFKPLPCRSHKPFSSSSLYGLRVYQPITFISLGSSTSTSRSTSTTTSSSISARYGGGSGGGGRRSRSEEDQALDISSLRSEKVRLIDEQQTMVGIVSKFQALQMAEDAELDLNILETSKVRTEPIVNALKAKVILSPEADPPVVRIMDYNKYRYELQKKKKDQQKKSAASRMGLKELKMGYKIDVHDYSVRLRAAQKFLKDGDKVKVIVSLKGRENEFRNHAIELIRRFQNDLGELAIEENKNFRERNIFIVLVPNKTVVQKAQEPPKNKEKSAATEVSASV